MSQQRGRELFCGLGKQQDSDPASQAPLARALWGEGGTSRHREYGQCQGLVRALCHHCLGSDTSPMRATSSPCPLFSLPGWGRGDQSISPHHSPPTTVTVEGGCASREQRVPWSPFHPSTSGPFPPFVTQFGSIIPALAPGHVPGSEVMDSTAGENSPVGRDVGGLLAQLQGVGRPQGFLSQHPTRQPAQGPLPAGFSLLPSSLPTSQSQWVQQAHKNQAAP